MRRLSDPVHYPTELLPESLTVVGERVRRLVAPNPGLMTGPGTNTYVLGAERFLVIDPGPDDPGHVARMLEVTQGRVDAVLVTHTHRDHSPAAATLAAATGAVRLGRPAPYDTLQDRSFVPTRLLADGDFVASEAGILRVLHTPGHASNHLCFLLEEQSLLFTGDHLIQGGTVVIPPPDGRMRDYLRSLERLLDEPVRRLAPGHGAIIPDAHAEIRRIHAHRLARESRVLARLELLGASDLDRLVGSVYDDVPRILHRWARHSLLAHLIKLEEEGRVQRASDRWRLAGERE